MVVFLVVFIIVSIISFFVWGTESLTCISGIFTGVLITVLTLFPAFRDPDNLEFVLNPKEMTITLESGSILKITDYTMSKSDSTRVKIKAKKQTSDKNNDFTNFN